MASSTDRYIRQSAILPMEKLADCPVTIIGVGAIGRQVALQLAVMGVSPLTLIDFDIVEVANLGAQGWREGDLGKAKVHAAAEVMAELNPHVQVIPLNRRFTRSEDQPTVIFCCVDSIETRRHIFSATKDRLRFFVDGRMSAESLRILTVCDRGGLIHYPSTLFAQEEAHRGACTARTTFYCASIAAGLMVASFAKWIRGIVPPVDLSLNILADELVVIDQAASVLIPLIP